MSEDGTDWREGWACPVVQWRERLWGVVTKGVGRGVLYS